MKAVLTTKCLVIMCLIAPSLFSMEKPPEPMELSVQEYFPIEKLPTHLKAYFLTFLTRGIGKTRGAKLHNAAETLRNYMMINKSFAVLLTDEQSSKVLVEYLARYTGGNLTQAGLALATVGARKYVGSLFCGHNRWCFSIEQEINWAAAQGDDAALATLIKCRHNMIPTEARLYAARGGHLSTIGLLYAPEISIYDNEPVLPNQNSPLIMACQNGHTHVAQKLLEKGVDPCYISRQWNHSTALFAAAEWGRLDCVNLLLATNARSQVDFQDRHRRTALMFASERGDSQVVKALLAAGAKVNLLDHVRLTALTRAVGTDCSSADYITIVQDLLAAGVDVTVRCDGPNGKTALGFARKGQEHSIHKKEIEKILLAHGATE